MGTNTGMGGSAPNRNFQNNTQTSKNNFAGGQQNQGYNQGNAMQGNNFSMPPPQSMYMQQQQQQHQARPQPPPPTQQSQQKQQHQQPHQMAWNQNQGFTRPPLPMGGPPPPPPPPSQGY